MKANHKPSLVQFTRLVGITPAGKIRKGFNMWAIEADERRRLSLRDGMVALGRLQCGNIRRTFNTKTTSGVEFGVGKDIAKLLKEHAASYPRTRIVFNLEFDEAKLKDQEFQIQLIADDDISIAKRLLNLASAPKIPKARIVQTVVFDRNIDVVIERLRMANGSCEQCEKPAPFKRNSNGTDYLEVHHLVRLADGGEDTIENTRALCPNCHRRFHHGPKF